MMHVAVLSDGYPPWEDGGAQRVAAQLAEGYRERGHQVTVITTARDRADDGSTEAGGLPVHRLYSPRPRALLPYLSVVNPLSSPRVGTILGDVEPDVVHAHNVHWLGKGTLVEARRRGLPVVKTYHDAGTFAYGEYAAHVDEAASAAGSQRYEVNPLAQWRREGWRYFPFRNRLNRRLLAAGVDAGVAVSSALQDALQANGMPCPHVVHNGIEPPDRPGSAAEQAFRNRHGLARDPIVLFGGRTSYEKGGHHLARALARVRDQGHQARLLVTGDDGYVDEMRAAAGEHADAIAATGWLDRAELATAYGVARVVATPSIHLDPFPTVNLEALAAGTPVVTTCFGGASELVRDGVEGRVVNPLDVDALAEALAGYLADPQEAKRAGQAGRRRIQQAFTLDAQVEAYLDLLATVVDARRYEEPVDGAAVAAPQAGETSELSVARYRRGAVDTR